MTHVLSDPVAHPDEKSNVRAVAIGPSAAWHSFAGWLVG